MFLVIGGCLQVCCGLNNCEVKMKRIIKGVVVLAAILLNSTASAESIIGKYTFSTDLTGTNLVTGSHIFGEFTNRGTDADLSIKSDKGNPSPAMRLENVKGIADYAEAVASKKYIFANLQIDSSHVAMLTRIEFDVDVRNGGSVFEVWTNGISGFSLMAKTDTLVDLTSRGDYTADLVLNIVLDTSTLMGAENVQLRIYGWGTGNPGAGNDFDNIEIYGTIAEPSTRGLILARRR